VIVDTDGSLNNASGAAGGTMPMLASEYATSIVNAHQLQLMAMDPTASYTLAGDFDAAATGSSTSATTGTDVWGGAGFIPIGESTAFTGTFNGLGNSISNLTISSSDQYVGLFGQVGAGGAVENVSLVGGSVSTTNSIADIGGLVGLLDGVVENAGEVGISVSASGADSVAYVGGLVGLVGAGGGLENVSLVGGSVSASGTDSVADVGGLVGYNEGTISDAYATGAVSGDSDAGGLVGVNNGGTISDAYATGAVNGLVAGGLVGDNGPGSTISDAYATGAVTGIGSGSDIGGLVGASNGTIENAYATGTVSDGGDVGGLVGENEGMIEDAYATGALSDGSYIGGLVGNDAGGSYIDVYYDTTSTGATAGAGANSSSGMIGLTTQDWLTEGPIATGAWSTGTWVAGYPYPVLRALPYIVVSASGSQTYGTSTPTVTVDGATDQNGNDASDLLDASGLSWMTSASSSSNVGIYALGGMGATAAGYQIAYQGTDTVDPATVTVTLTGTVSKTYNGTDAATVGAGNYTLSGLVGSDQVFLNDPTLGTYADANVGGGIAVTVTGLVLSGPDAQDYVLAASTITGNVGAILAASTTGNAGATVPAVPNPLPVWPMPTVLPQPTPSGDNAIILTGDGNGLAPLPQIISATDGLPLSTGAEQTLYGAAHGPHFTIDLPPPQIALTGLEGAF
jgi:hypothetical protein